MLISFLCIGFFSCSKDDNPIVPPVVDTTYHFDSARYNWTSIELEGYLTDLLVIDTNKIFISTRNTIIKSDGISLTYYNVPDTMVVDCIGGIDETQIYIGGSNTNIEHTVPLVAHFQEPEFSVSETPNPTNLNYYVSDVFPKDNNSIFFGTVQGRNLIVKNNNQFNYYEIDSILPSDTTPGFRTLYTSGIFWENNSNVKCVCFHQTINNIGTESYGFYKIMNYNGSNWNSEYQKNFGQGELTFSLKSLGNELYDIENNKILKYNGNGFVNFLSNPNIRFYKFLFAGTEENNFMISAETSTGGNIMHWNGSKFSKEIPDGKASAFIGKTKKGNYYILSFNQFGAELKIGRPKH